MDKKTLPATEGQMHSALYLYKAGFSMARCGECALLQGLGSAFALVPVPFVEEVAVTIVNIVNVVAVLDSLVATAFTMDMVVILMNAAVHFQ